TPVGFTVEPGATMAEVRGDEASEAAAGGPAARRGLPAHLRGAYVLAELPRRCGPLFATAIHAGLRKGGLRALRTADVDGEKPPEPTEISPASPTAFSARDTGFEPVTPEEEALTRPAGPSASNLFGETGTRRRRLHDAAARAGHGV